MTSTRKYFYRFLLGSKTQLVLPLTPFGQAQTQQKIPKKATVVNSVDSNIQFSDLFLWGASYDTGFYPPARGMQSKTGRR